MIQKRYNPLIVNSSDEYPDVSKDIQEAATPSEVNLKEILSRTGWALFLMALATLGSQFLIVRLVYFNLPELYASNWFGIALSALSTAGIGYPLFITVIRKLPDIPRQEKKSLSIGQFLGVFFVCIAFMYSTNFITSIILLGLSAAKKQELVNPVEVMLNNSNMYLNIAYVAIIGPIMEEIVFRKYLLNTLRWIGDRSAILLSGLAFGLFHMNLNQFLYAAALGAVFAYICLRTNTIRYTIILHIMINSIGIVAAQIALSNNEAIIAIFFLWILISISLGVVLFARYKQRMIFEKPVLQWRIRDCFSSLGILLYLLLCIGIIIYEIM